LIFANLIDFDQLYGHRNNPQGYAEALEEFDERLPEIIAALSINDVLLITADHGNDPTTPSTDHSRERVPLLAAGYKVKPNINIGTRKSFCDVAATISAMLLEVEGTVEGEEFAKDILLANNH
jgi:phosphopentomutase